MMFLLPVSLFSSSFDLIRHVPSFSLVMEFLVTLSQIPLDWIKYYKIKLRSLAKCRGGWKEDVM
jgi:hypothetical protein